MAPRGQAARFVQSLWPRSGGRTVGAAAASDARNRV